MSSIRPLNVGPLAFERGLHGLPKHSRFQRSGFVTLPPPPWVPTPNPGRADATPALMVMLVGGVFAILLSWVSIFAIVACFGVVGTNCAAVSTLLLLPFITGLVAITLSVLGFVRPHLRRLFGVVVLALSGSVVGIGLGIFAPYPDALIFVIVLYAWPVFLILAGSIYLVALGKPPSARNRFFPVPQQQ